jgi:hypothetical protein
MSDDQIRAAMGRPTGSLGERAWKDVKDNVLGGPLAIAKRGVSDVGSALEGNFRPAAGDVLGIMKALNPLRAAWENAKTLGTAVQDPAAAARAVGQKFHDRPVSTSLAVASAAAPLLGAGARLAGIGGRSAALIDGVGNLTTDGEAAFARAGINPENLTPAQLRAVAEAGSIGGRGAEANMQLAHRTALADEAGTPLTAGQATGDNARLAAEDQLRKARKARVPRRPCRTPTRPRAWR